MVVPVAPWGVTVLAAFFSSAKALLPSVTGMLPSVSPLLPEALPSVSWDLPSAMGSSLIAVGWVMPWEGRAAAAASAGDSWVERAEAGGALVLTGSSDVVRPEPGHQHNWFCKLLIVRPVHANL